MPTSLEVPSRKLKVKVQDWHFRNSTGLQSAESYSYEPIRWREYMSSPRQQWLTIGILSQPSIQRTALLDLGSSNLDYGIPNFLGSGSGQAFPGPVCKLSAVCRLSGQAVEWLENSLPQNFSA